MCTSSYTAKSNIIDAWRSEVDCSTTHGVVPPLAEQPQFPQQLQAKPRGQKRKRKLCESESEPYIYTMSNSPTKPSTRHRLRIDKSQSETAENLSKQTQVDVLLQTEAPLSSPVSVASSRYANALQRSTSSGDAGATCGLALTPSTTLSHPSESRKSRPKSANSRSPAPRSRSPVKCMLDLRQASPPTEQVSVEEAMKDSTMPQSLLGIENKVRLALRYSFFPRSIKVQNISLTPSFLLYYFSPSYLLASTNVSSCRMI
jgi:hypothetical protein